MNIESSVAEQATGCRGAGDYRAWAKEQGYDYCEVYDWTSSAGDWTFVVSKNGYVWYLMSQDNNYPRSGFTRTIDLDRPWVGTAEEVCEQIAAFYGD